MTPIVAQLRAIYDRPPSMFDPRSAHAHTIAVLGWALTAISVVVFVVVMALLLVPIWRRRGVVADDGPPVPVNERAWLLYAGTLAPATVLLAVFVVSLSAFRSEIDSENHPALTITVIGHQWWWEVQYPEQGFETANELHLPVGRSVRVLLQSPDVIHSFWIPNLAGKTDVIPGSQTVSWLEADTAGIWRGTCAEYCGPQHGHMAITVVAESPADFAKWTTDQASSSVAPDAPDLRAGQAAFLGAQCAYCHTVRGTPASGRAGPDLTHIASRLTLAGGLLPNTRGNLGGWIENPDRLKPGTLMPPVPLDGAQLQAVLAYLESLR